MRVDPIRATCFACSLHIEGRSAADYVNGKIQRFHATCLASRKRAQRKLKPASSASQPHPYFDWRHRNRTRQLIALAVGLRRLKRRARGGRNIGGTVRVLLRAESEAELIGMPLNFRVGAS